MARSDPPRRMHLEDFIQLIPFFLNEEELALVREVCNLTVARAEKEDQRAGWVGGDTCMQRGCIFQTWKDGRLPAGHGAQANRELSTAALTSRERFQRLHLGGYPQGYADLLLGPKMLGLSGSLLTASTCFLFNDQFIVKPPQCCASAFPWHKDSDWCAGRDDVGCSTYFSVWVALDDVSKENGGFHVHIRGLKGASAGREWRVSEQQEKGPSGTSVRATTCEDCWEEVELAPLPAGTAVIFRDDVEHCSGPNLGSTYRRVWMPQYSQAPIAYSSGPHAGSPLSLAIPLHAE
eukprot:jgi/Botrbrau1/2270/Bobra.101_2s0093.1